MSRNKADIVAVTANLAAGEVGPDAIADVTAERFDEKLGWVRDAAGDRFDALELNVLVMSAQLTDDRDTAREATAALFGMTPDAVAESPILLMGTPAQIADDLRARRERWGFSYVVVQGHDTAEALAPVVAELTGT